MIILLQLACSEPKTDTRKLGIVLQYPVDLIPYLGSSTHECVRKDKDDGMMMLVVRRGVVDTEASKQCDGGM